MRLILKKWMVVIAVALLTRAAGAQTFTASLDNDTITLGQSATLTLTFEGGQPQNSPAIPAISNLLVRDNSHDWTQNFRLVVVNNQNQSDLVLTHPVTLVPRAAGEFIIPALSVDIGGKHLSSSPLKLTVLKPDAPTSADINSGNELAFMTLKVTSNKVYLGQQVTAQLQIYLRDDVQNFGNFQFSGQNTDGFLLGKSAQGGKSRAQVGNRIYTVIPLTYALTVMKSGPLTVGPFTANAVVVVPSDNQSGGFPFFNQGEEKQVSLATEIVKVEGRPLPDQNRPANFNGAIGNFTMAVSVGPTNVTVGDPVTVHVQITGHGALDSVTLPDQSALSGFKVFSPTVKTLPGDQLGLDGSKTFEEIVTPQNADVREWPQFSFSFFNPDDGRYHTLTQPAVTLAVRPAGSAPLPAFEKNPAPENQTPADISPIKETPGTFASQAVPLVGQPAFLALQSLPVLAFLAAFVWRKRTNNLANNPRLRRQRAVAQIISHGLTELKTFATKNQPDEFFATLFRLLQEQLGERLDCPASAITENVIEEQPVLRNAPPATRAGLRELFQLCNQARYAPVRGTSELNSVAAQFQKVVVELQDLPT